MTTFLRLFIPCMFPEYDKGIYLDSDIVVLGDIAEIYDLDFRGNILGAVHDKSVCNVKPLVKYIENAVGVSRDQYVNSGILLMDMKKMREISFEAHFLRLLNTWHFDCIAPDQDYINAMCRDHILYMSPNWDVMPIEGSETVPSPKLIHYHLFAKPWCYDNIQYEDYFWEYAKETPFYDEIVHHKSHYTEEERESDHQAMNRLLERSLFISQSENTFREVFESGKESRKWMNGGRSMDSVK